MNVNKRTRDESVQNEPLDLTMGIRSSPVSIMHGIKKTKTTECNEEAVESSLKKKRVRAVEEDPGARYPIDVWFLIANYIDPENVGKFARICRDTLHVTETAVFWSRLYKRYYVPGSYLSVALKPNTLKVRFGLRTRVIRALHLMHKPLMIKRETSLKQPILRNRMVVRQWLEKNNARHVRNQWIYYFELRDTDFNRQRVSRSNEECRNDIAVNPSEACVMLKITCAHRMRLPLLVGLTVHHIDIEPMEGKLLQMKCTLSYRKNNKIEFISVELSPIIRSQILNWWSPRYPHMIPIPVVAI